MRFWLGASRLCYLKGDWRYRHDLVRRRSSGCGLGVCEDAETSEAGIRRDSEHEKQSNEILVFASWHKVH